METVRLSVRDGEVQDAGSWLYVWRPTGRDDVLYVGGTGLPPVVRSWLHLHHDDPDVARVAHRHPDALTQPMEVVAFRLEEEIDRAVAKAELVRRLARAGLLAEDYVGDAPQPGEAPDDVRRLVAQVVVALASG